MSDEAIVLCVMSVSGVGIAWAMAWWMVRSDRQDYEEINKLLEMKERIAEKRQ